MQDRAATPSVSTRRWRLQVSLRALLVLVVLFSLPLAALAYRLNQVRQRRHAVMEIERLGGMTTQCHLLPTDDDWSQWCPDRVHTALGDDFFQTINYAELNGEAFNDQNLALVRALPQLRSLHIRRARITDDGLVHLHSLGVLESLFVDEVPITDRGLRHIGRRSHLRYLTLRGTSITDAGLAELKNLPLLESLTLDRTKITDAGLRQLHGIKTLRKLYLEEVPVTDAGVDELKQAIAGLEVER